MRRGYDIDGADGYVPVFEAGKRLGLVWQGDLPWDWFVGWSPRNHSSYAEGPWDHWVDFALKILSDPLTQIVRPEEYQPDARDRVVNFYSEKERGLSEDELRARFPQ